MKKIITAALACAMILSSLCGCAAREELPPLPEKYSLMEENRVTVSKNQRKSGMCAAFAAVNTALIKTGKMTLEALIDRISIGPRAFLGLPTQLKVGDSAELVVFDPDAAFTIDSSKFLSAAKATPLDGMECFGSIEYTIYDGRIVWDRNALEN